MGRLCKSQGCTRPVNGSRSKKTGRISTPPYCGSCRAKREKERDLVAWAYRKLKSNAKRRGIFFDLTEQQFREFCYETQILLGRGRTATSYHVDRIRDELGYTVGNLQKLTNTENVKKDALRRKIVKWVEPTCEYERGDIKTVEITLSDDSDVPF
jgi:hypothetical protein